MSTSEAWLSVTNLVTQTGTARLSAPSISIAAGYVALLDRAAELLPLLLRQSHWLSGQVALGGRPLGELLARGEAGYAPAELPGDERLGSILETSARLVGASPSDAHRAATRLGLAGALRTRLSRLSRVEVRLGGLAHALVTEPRFLLLEDLLVDLEPHEADRVELGLDAALGDVAKPRSVLFACHSRSRRSFARLRSHRARQEALTVLAAVGPSHDYLIRAVSPGSLAPKSAYIELGAGEAPAFAQKATERGLPAISLPGGHLVLVDRADQDRTVELAQALGLQVIGVEDAHFAPS